jgi:uncharacterized protein (DUF362 family)
MKECLHKGFANMDRREFCKKSLAAGAAVCGASLFGWTDRLVAQEASTAIPDLVTIENDEPDVMFDKAIAALGGMEKFVQKGQTVVVKPNIGWERGPETAANTNPLLIKRIVEHCVNVGAKKVYVFDNSVYSASGPKCYKISGIEDAAKTAGATVAPAHEMKYFQEVTIPGAETLEKTQVHELLLETDVLINVPVLKNHFASHLTIAMKNLMGVVWNRNQYHSKGLHECIADFCLYKKPDLNVVDAYLVTMANGPQGARQEDLALKKTLLLSQDIVAVDAAATKFFGIEPEQVAHIKLGHEQGTGNMNVEELNIKKIVL